MRNIDNKNEFVVKAPVWFIIVWILFGVVVFAGAVYMLGLNGGKDYTTDLRWIVMLVIFAPCYIFYLFALIFKWRLTVSPQGIESGKDFYEFSEIESIKLSGNGHVYISTVGGKNLYFATYFTNAGLLCKLASDKGVDVDPKMFTKFRTM